MQDQTSRTNKGMALYILTRGLLAVVLVVVVLWALTLVLGKIKGPEPQIDATLPTAQETLAVDKNAQALLSEQAPVESSSTTPKALSTQPAEALPVPLPPKATGPVDHATLPAPKTPDLPPQPQAAVPTPVPQAVTPLPSATPTLEAQPKPASPAPQAGLSHAPAEQTNSGLRPTGMVFVDAAIKPLEYEVKKRFWGWRPNDIINVTDNVNNFQLGVLEVTRRTVVQLTERISRTGSTDAIDRNLENAMNWLMIKASSYWFPSPESKYKESLDELARYREKLLNGNAYFYIRADNIIPLLAVYEDLLGSCDENLVKHTEKDGSKVGYFRTDDYFYYAKGVASTMATMLEAVQTDFAKTLENRRGSELLHHAIESCRRAAELEPLLVTDGDLDGFLANHRANMAAPISHASYYLGQLIKTLST